MNALCAGGFVLRPDHRIIGVGPDPVGIVGAQRLGRVGGPDLAAVGQAVVDRLEIAERSRLLGEGDEVAAEHVAEHRIRLLGHLRRDERREVALAELGPLLVDDLDVGPRLLDVVDEGGDRVASVGIVGRDGGNPLHLLPARDDRRAGAAVDVGVGGETEDVGMQVCRRRELDRLRRRRDEHDLVFLGDGRHRRRLRRGQRPRQEVDIVLDDQFAREPHRLVGARLAVARQKLELAAEDAAGCVDLLHGHFGALDDRHAIDRSGSGQRHRIADLDRIGGERHRHGICGNSSNDCQQKVLQPHRHPPPCFLAFRRATTSLGGIAACGNPRRYAPANALSFESA